MLLIIDLHLKGNLVIIIGAGVEGLKKINLLLAQNCKILVIAEKPNTQIAEYVAKKKIEFKEMRLDDAKILAKYKPYLVMATTNDATLNGKIVREAKEIGCLAYASDDPEISDFAHPSVIDIDGVIQVAISTKGKSPAMTQKIRRRAEKIFRDTITPHDINTIRLQEVIRQEAKRGIKTQRDRRSYLYQVINDLEIKQLIKDNKVGSAKRRAMQILKEWK